MYKLVIAIAFLLLDFTMVLMKPKQYSSLTTALPQPVAFKNMLGVNAFEWNFLQDPANPNDGLHIYEPKMRPIKSFGAVRHYLDWEKIEPLKDHYTFNPTNKGGWNLDAIYQRCKEDSIDVLVCLKNCPAWLQDTYPSDERDPENVPSPYGLDRSAPASYIEQAKAGFQFAARYGSNKKIDPSLISVDHTPRWNGDPVNVIKIGMNLIKYIECDNERDKWWKGEKAHQSAREYAANLSAFYDGDKGRLGKGVGVKNADSKMLVVMAGLASTDIRYVEDMIEWCKENRGYRKDGSVDLCFDVINFHLYANDHKQNAGDKRTTGIAPELSEAGTVSDDFVKLASAYHLPVWITEAGYDVNQGSPQKAKSIGNKTALVTQADWIIRTAFLYARHDIAKLFFYELYDDNVESVTQYASSGLVDNNMVRRPAANYIAEVKNLMGQYCYKRTISQYPLIDEYEYQHKTIYVAMSPTEVGKKVVYNFPLSEGQKITIYHLSIDSQQMSAEEVSAKKNRLEILITETPMFIKKVGENIPSSK